MPQIPYGKKEGEELPRDGCQGSVKDSDLAQYRIETAKSDLKET